MYTISFPSLLADKSYLTHQDWTGLYTILKCLDQNPIVKDMQVSALLHGRKSNHTYTCEMVCFNVGKEDLLVLRLKNDLLSDHLVIIE